VFEAIERERKRDDDEEEEEKKERTTERERERETWLKVTRMSIVPRRYASMIFSEKKNSKRYRENSHFFFSLSSLFCSQENWE